MPKQPISVKTDANAKQLQAKCKAPLKRGKVPDPAGNRDVELGAATQSDNRRDQVDGSSNGTNRSEAQSPATSGSPRDTKKSRAIALLRTEIGIPIAGLSAMLGWQPHTNRAALSRLRKAGFAIVVDKPANGNASLYRLADSSEANLPARAAQ